MGLPSLLGVSLVAQTVKHLPAMQEKGIQSLGQEDPWRREWLPTPVFLPGEFHEQRSLTGTVLEKVPHTPTAPEKAAVIRETKLYLAPLMRPQMFLDTPV